MKRRILTLLLALALIVSLFAAMGISASAEETGHTHCVCGTEHSEIGDHTEEESITYQPWDGTGTITYTNGVAYVYLTAIRYVNQYVLKPIEVASGQTLYLCLNGYNITTTTFDVYGIKIASGGTLILCDCSTEVHEGYITASSDKPTWNKGTSTNTSNIPYDIVGGMITNFKYLDTDTSSSIINKGTLKMYGINFVNNSSKYGAINSSGSYANTYIYGCTIVGNTSGEYYAGGIYNDKSSTMNIVGCEFAGNSSGNGGAITNHGSSTLNVDDCTFIYNYASLQYDDTYGGGAIYNSDSSKATITNSSFVKNTAKEAGAALANLATAEVVNCKFSDNTAKSLYDIGGAIYNTSSMTLTNCELTGNIGTSTFSNGGAVCNYSGNITINNCVISNNQAARGGGIYLSGGTLNLKDTVITGNLVTKSYGGGVFFSTDASAVNISGNTIIAYNYSTSFVKNNLYVDSSKIITIKDDLGADAKIGISLSSSNSAPYAFTGNNSKDYSANFVADKSSSYHIENDSNNTLKYVSGKTDIFYDVSVDSNMVNGAVTLDKAQAKESETVTITVTPNGACSVDTVTVMTPGGATVSVKGPNASGNYTFTMPGELVIVSATFVIKYSLSATTNLTNAGNITGVGSYSYGETVTLTATANTGYTFINWTENGNVVSTDATIEVTVEADRSLIANFKANNYTVTAVSNIEAAGSVSGAGDYDHGTTATLTATPNAGYTFVNWTEGETVVGTDATIEITIEAARNLVANFKLNNYTVDAVSNIEAAGSVSGAGDYDHGTTATLTATPNTGYTFVNWTDGETVVGTDATIEITVEADRSLVANFEAIICNVNVSFGIEGVDNETVAIEYAGTLSLENPEIEGYDFVGWYADAAFENAFDFTQPITENITVYARMTASMVKIEKTSIEESTVTYTITYSDGTTSTFTVGNGSEGEDTIYDVEAKDGIAPKLRRNTNTEEWEISYDNGTTWSPLGFKTTEKDNDENTGDTEDKGDTEDTENKGDTEDTEDKGNIEDTEDKGNEENKEDENDNTAPTLDWIAIVIIILLILLILCILL